MQYIIMDEQDKDWNPVISKFVAEGFSEGFLDHKRRYEFGVRKKTFQLSEKAFEAGYNDINDLFNKWYNHKRSEKVNP